MKLNSYVLSSVAVILAILLLAVSAQFDLPVPYTPIRHSAQTVAVVLIGCLLGWRLGVVAVVGYLLVGLLGAPVFSHGGAGWLHLSGPTGGFLAGFVVAAGVAGAMSETGHTRGFIQIFTLALFAHAIILLGGWLGLLALADPVQAYAIGIAPFLDGALLKSIVLVPLVAGLGALRALPWRGA